MFRRPGPIGRHAALRHGRRPLAFSSRIVQKARMSESGNASGRTIELRRPGGAWQAAGAFGAFLKHPFFRRGLLPALVVLVLLKFFVALNFTYVQPNESGI